MRYIAFSQGKWKSRDETKIGAASPLAPMIKKVASD
jgi:hypothetical protein